MTVSHQTILVSGYLQNSFRPLASKHSSLSCTELAVWRVHNKKNEVLKCNFLQFLKTDFSINAHFFIIHTTLFLQKIQAAKSHECEHAYHCQNKSRRLITTQSAKRSQNFLQSINQSIYFNNYYYCYTTTISKLFSSPYQPLSTSQTSIFVTIVKNQLVCVFIAALHNGTFGRWGHQGNKGSKWGFRV